MTSDTLLLLLPEIVLVLVAVGIYVAGAFSTAAWPWRWIALAGVLAAAAAFAVHPPAGSTAGLLATDALSGYLRGLALAAGAILVLLVWRPLDTPATPERAGSLLLAVAGLMLAGAARDLALLFVGLELISIPTYVLLYLGPRGTAHGEATAKYFFLSIFASAILLYGFSLLYGVFGSTALPESPIRWGQGGRSAELLPLAEVALVLVFAGVGFKIAAFPFHFYAPDVYQGTTHGNAALLSVVPKAAGIVALVRIVAVALPDVGAYPWRIAMALAIVTMTFGNVMALWQDSVRRLLAYSSIAHAGYMLLGLSVFLASLPGGSGAWDGVGAMLFYLLVYALATLGAFAALACLGKDDVQIDAVDELAGLAWTPGLLRRLLAWTLAVCLFSLAGIPPLAGFWGKLAVFFSALSLGDIAAPARPWMIALAVIGVVNAVIGAAYYLRVVAAMFFRIPLGTLPVKRAAGGTLIAAVLSAALVVGIGVLPGPWLRTATLASPGRGTVEHESVGRETVERESVGRQTVERESVKRETDAPIHGPRTHGLTAHGRSG